MSELTSCNRCSLNRMIREAAERGATVRTYVVPDGEVMAGWTRVMASDRDSGSYFMEITEGCAC